ncbi:hypothetical protein B0T17DRAFT_74908 [Bombardia bombarda]|uniref:Uncharacterized protein n=1 Tax=Bombardia bombarda TaxID=252184 RepID=A0AA40CG49_9PEZI|nr:hypothetical protein B0T17DRAFT_74908 [Bombardia bombarda]
MADRHGAPGTRHGGGISKPRSNIMSTGGGPSASSVRRNLFQSQLTRRPTARGSLASNETLRLDTDMQQQSDPLSLSSSSDIVIRDQNGEIELGDPPTPLLDDPEGLALDTRQENERERQRLAEAVKQHQIDQNSVPAQPEELFDAVRASLRAKVAALAEDNWMFEREEAPRHQ